MCKLNIIIYAKSFDSLLTQAVTFEQYYIVEVVDNRASFYLLAWAQYMERDVLHVVFL